MKLEALLPRRSGTGPWNDEALLTVDEARKRIQRLARPVSGVERVPLRGALGRVLAEDVIAGMDVPPHDNAGMDGYALSGVDLADDGSAALTVVGTGLAGHAFGGIVPAGCCVRVMTGAVMPAGCDTVVPQESCRIQVGAIHIPAGALRRGDNRRRRGEDLQAGKPALDAGKLLRPADLGLIASLGLPEVVVRRKLRVAFLSSGDELCTFEQPRDAGSVYDSNRYALWGALERLGCDGLDLGVVRDEPAALQAALRLGCETADAVITTGGVGEGAADHLRNALAALGQVAFWRIAMRPGRPMAFGRIASGPHEAVLFGLPGNPVAALAAFYHIAREGLLGMMGARTKPLPLLRVTALCAMRKVPGRIEYQRAVLEPTKDGRLGARLTGNQGSGVLRSMSLADGFVVLGHDQAAVRAGEPVDFLAFEGLV